MKTDGISSPFHQEALPRLMLVFPSNMNKDVGTSNKQNKYSGRNQITHASVIVAACHKLVSHTQMASNKAGDSCPSYLHNDGGDT